ncbi:MAG: hypothetical protein WC712_05745, partial [Candidatus Brocadiia bacterium]
MNKVHPRFALSLLAAAFLLSFALLSATALAETIEIVPGPEKLAEKYAANPAIVEFADLVQKLAAVEPSVAVSEYKAYCEKNLTNGLALCYLVAAFKKADQVADAEVILRSLKVIPDGNMMAIEEGMMNLPGTLQVLADVYPLAPENSRLNYYIALTYHFYGADDKTIAHLKPRLLTMNSLDVSAALGVLSGVAQSKQNETLMSSVVDLAAAFYLREGHYPQELLSLMNWRTQMVQLLVNKGDMKGAAKRIEDDLAKYAREVEIERETKFWEATAPKYAEQVKLYFFEVQVPYAMFNHLFNAGLIKIRAGEHEQALGPLEKALSGVEAVEFPKEFVQGIGKYFTLQQGYSILAGLAGMANDAE